MDTPLLSRQVKGGLWALRVVLILMMPGVWPKLGAIALLLVMPFAKRLVLRQVHGRLISTQGDTDATTLHHTR